AFSKTEISDGSVTHLYHLENDWTDSAVAGALNLTTNSSEATTTSVFSKGMYGTATNNYAVNGTALATHSADYSVSLSYKASSFDTVTLLTPASDGTLTLLGWYQNY